jgi:hypothetical protein
MLDWQVAGYCLCLCNLASYMVSTGRTHFRTCSIQQLAVTKKQWHMHEVMAMAENCQVCHNKHTLGGSCVSFEVVMWLATGHDKQ